MKLSSLLVATHMVYERFVMWMIEHWRYALTLVLLAFCATGGVVGWRSYRAACEARAHKAYLEVVRLVNTDVKSPSKEASGYFGTEQEKNEAIISLGDLFLAQHASTSFAPTVLALIARSLNEIGKKEEARVKMHAAEKACSSTDIRQVYALSGALMDLDSQDATAQESGLAALKVLAKNSSSAVCDAALFYLGEFFWAQQNYQEARLWWAQLVNVADKKQTELGTDVTSVWVAAAREKLSLIDYR